MIERAEKQIMTKIPDGTVWDSFLEHIQSVHGKTYGHIGMEVQNALKQYVENYDQVIIQKYESEINALKTENEHLKGSQEKYDQLFDDYRKLRNKYDHLQERFNKSQNELNLSERENSQLRVVVAKIEKLSLWERLLNRLPSEMKQLKSGKEED
jgi:bisphosphoglycerate-dependent phosphoglycerate mutase